MKKNIDRQLDNYSKIDFQNDLRNFENDVNRRISLNQSSQYELRNIIERWFGISARVGASVMASTLILGVFLGTQVQTENSLSKQDALGFEVFRVESAKLPSSLLAPEL